MHPYKNMPDSAYWSRAISRVSIDDIDPVLEAQFLINQETKVATAGSCFAQHISRHLRAAGFNYFVAEKAHPIIPNSLMQEYNYGVFSARYGNIYTTRQLLQLFNRAFGDFEPDESFWQASKYSWIDPLRPQIQPNGFVGSQELEADRRQHLKAVREMFENLDVFVFTLGLTEGWVSRHDGTVYPICPGVSGGAYSPDNYLFKNFTVQEVVDDFQLFLDKLKVVNNSAKVMLTVSPVPLVATAENTHVLNATTLSKAVLRVAAETICMKNKNVAYFPSYEIITGNFSKGAYFGKDCRSITEDGVNHVMKLFFKHYAKGINLNKKTFEKKKTFNQQEFAGEITDIAKVNCDEVYYDDKLNTQNIREKS